ncbi:MAG TPA: cytochrome C oxidase subunit IV family protein [Mycobacteriales bacterium]|nr:cytochrome C oxidase subunit IV family protein [Mycobacteriales bacterium]HWA65399.1 cytochrome C oxidase subunit IV family protein [Mycobacteriales bacterium]
MTSPSRSASHPSHRLTTTWLVAGVLTVASWAVTISFDTGRAKANTTVAVIGLALGAVKVRLIVQQFMDVRTAPRWLRMFTDVWLAVLALTLLATYLAS